MTEFDIVGHVRSTHSQCCLTRKSGERNCSLNMRGFDPPSVVMLDGSKYQREHSYGERLCDRIVFGRWEGTDFVCAAELKGGGNLDVSEAIQQIQNGLSVAASLLSGHEVENWFPVLLFRGGLRAIGTTKLRTRLVTLPTRQRNPLEIIKRDCGSCLAAILRENAPTQ